MRMVTPAHLAFPHAFREAFDTLAEVSSFAVFWKDSRSRFLGCNRVFARRVGAHEPRDIIGLSDGDLPLLTPEHRSYLRWDRIVMDTGVARRGIVEPLWTPAGERTWVSTDKMPIRDERGVVVGLLGAFGPYDPLFLHPENVPDPWTGAGP